jgi:hypothetical protein
MLRFITIISVVFLVSCKSINQEPVSPKFHDDFSADVVFIYYSESSIFITIPDTRENGFLPLLTWGDIEYRLNNKGVNRNFAIIVIGQLAIIEQRMLINNLQNKLINMGFRRVVCLLCDGGTKVDGLIILNDCGNSRSISTNEM